MNEDRIFTWDTPILCLHNLCEPGSVAVFEFGEGFLGDDGVLSYLEIEHADADELGAAGEGIREAAARMNGPGGQRLE